MPEVRVVHLDATPYISMDALLSALQVYRPRRCISTCLVSLCRTRSASYPSRKVSKDDRRQIPSSSHLVSSSPVTHSRASFFRPRDHPLPSNALAHRPRTRPVRSGQPRPAQPSPVQPGQVSTPPASFGPTKSAPPAACTRTVEAMATPPSGSGDSRSAQLAPTCWRHQEPWR
ncbi:hypothetical protein CI102_13242 [Trichoderma harzianum]|nr:hypothetical protein CI102_13242 [Trichoderma harzianum]